VPAATTFAEHVAAVVDAIPPLTEQQRAGLALLMRGMGDTLDDPPR
jgi:hypothetical protein